MHMDRTQVHGKTTVLSGSLRIAAAIALLGAAVASGWLARSPWIIAALTLAFSLCFIVGRLAAWRYLLRQRQPGKVLASLCSVLASQLLLVGLLYLVGAGLAATVGGGWQAQPLSRQDLVVVAVLGLVCAAMGYAAIRIEAAALADALSAAPARTDKPDWDLRLLGEPVTPSTLFSGIHFSHARFIDKDTGYDSTPNEASAGSEEKIRAAEVRLGITLPLRLREIYLHQNGGSVTDICIPKPQRAAPLKFEDILTPFGGYDDLYPTERLVTAWDTFLAFGDPNDAYYASLFSGGTDRMVVLAQWYRETLFLDYNPAGADPTPEPRVGFVDFDKDDWPDHVTWWPGFDAFFSELRRFETR